MKIYRENCGTVFLKGQHSCIIETVEGINEIFITVSAGKLRLNHGCFTPDGGTWLSAPAGERKAHYNLEAPQKYHIIVDIQKSFGRLDRINIVNLRLLKSAMATLGQIPLWDCQITMNKRSPPSAASRFALPWRRPSV